MEVPQRKNPDADIGKRISLKNDGLNLRVSQQNPALASGAVIETSDEFALPDCVLFVIRSVWICNAESRPVGAFVQSPDKHLFYIIVRGNRRISFCRLVESHQHSCIRAFAEILPIVAIN